MRNQNIKISSFKKGLLNISTIIFVLSSSKAVVSAEQNNVIRDSYVFEQNQLIYTTDEMFSFDIKSYLESNAPHLIDYAEVISHWSGYSSISPKVIIALIEQQTGLVSNEYLDVSVYYKPMGSLSDKHGFSEQVEDVAVKLAKYFYKTNDKTDLTAKTSLEQLFEGHQSRNIDNNSGIGEFYDIYYRLFPNEPTVESDSSKLSNKQYLFNLPPDNLLQLPYLVNKAWRYGGTHTNNGSGSFPQSSLDLNNGGSWGSNTSNIWVASAAPGRAKVHSSCNLEIIHPGGWSTTYYHLDNIKVRTNDTVTRNQKVANYANNKPQALCQGGHSTGPHQHFSLKKDGRYQHLNNVKLSGFKVHTGRDSYDSDCRYFWLEKNNTKYCAWTKLTNPGVPDGPGPDPDPDDKALKNGVPVTGLSASKGKQAYYKILVPAGARNLKIKISGGSGDADMHVKAGSRPTLSSWDCRPYKVTQLEECNYKTPKVTTYYVMLHAFSNYNNISLVASYDKQIVEELKDDVPITGLSAEKGNQKYYKIDIPTGASNLKIKVDGGTGDVDMHVKAGTKPTLSSWDCRPYKTTQLEVCSYKTPKTGSYYVLLNAFSNYNNVSLEASYSN
ncbi:pre-peptidase C-terminal domain-containing protein [Endozoicomonas sp. SM1973]|uniref:Pre-peptidase C-terminal domain-containing protein n=1 Tax=Spartinivicinus marinus TaxID=2994442 RepID=A0A853I1A5_9GAMM|nr:pre-peptidase C-terminal domain-containing protein [Spartinivicinus marinus]MCX4026694.1 pre-peptidase C-terminal domain-containing protein [Spartinivicinus marinus]NYZ64528.1 pre-peptidase C-terminal domain-containing protein [Spartinivicinus marinus]